MPKAKSKPFLQSMTEYYAEHPFVRVLVGLATTVLLAVTGIMLLSLVLASLANTLVNMATSMPLAGKFAELLVTHVAPFIASAGNAIAPQMVSLLAHLPIIPAISAGLALGILAAVAVVLLYTVLTAHKAAEAGAKQIEAQKQEQAEEPEEGRPMRKGRGNQDVPAPDMSERASASHGEEVEMTRRSGPGQSQQ